MVELNILLNFMGMIFETVIIVMPNGDVLPCRRLPIVVGNLMEQTLFEIYYSSELLWRLRDRCEVTKSAGNVSILKDA